MAFPDNLGPRTQPAWEAILELLADDDWHHHTELVTAAYLASDLTRKSIDELIRKGHRTRHYTRRSGKVAGQGKAQAAVYRLLDGGPR